MPKEKGGKIMEATAKQKVIELLNDNPELFSQSVAREVGISSQELQAIYQEIKGEIRPADKRTFGIPRFFQMVLETEVLPHKSRLKKFRKGEFVFPGMLELHLGKSCHCACRFCWRWSSGQWKSGDLGLYRGKKALSPLQKQDVMKLLQEFKDNGGTQLYLSGGLEFFTSDIAEDTIKSAAELGLTIRVYTNGVANCFDKEDFMDLILNKVQYIRFSLHAVKPETYAKVQMPHRNRELAKQEFLKAKGHIVKMVERRKQYKDSSQKAKIFVAFLVINDNFREVKDATDMWKEIGIDSFDIRVDMREKECWFTQKEENELERMMEEIRVQREKGIYEPMKVSGERHAARRHMKLPEKCFIPFKKPAVDPWGVVYTCCYGAHPSLQHHKYELGNLHEETLGEILKRLHHDGIIPLPHCGQCTDWELNYNRSIEKVLADWSDGFPPESLPFIGIGRTS